MPTTLTNGIQLPDKGSVDWYSSMQSNYNLIDTHLGDTDTHVTAEDKANWNSKQGSLSQAQLDAIAQVATNTSDIAALQSGKANASHTHSSSDITDIDDYATKQYVDNSISGLVDNAPAALDTLKELSTALNDDANFASTITTALAAKADSSDLATVATSGSYTDLDDKPTINDSTITIQKNGSTVDTFTTNGSAKTIDIPVPTKTSDLTNDSNFVDTSNSAVSSGITSAKVTSYDTHIADTDIHVTTADKATWNTVTSKANDSDVVHKSGNETVGGEKTFASNKLIVGRNTDTGSAIQFVNADVVGDSANGSSGFEVYGSSISDANKIGSITIGEFSNNGGSYATIECNRTVSGVKSSNAIRSLIRPNGLKELSATVDNDCKLGTEFLRWSKIYGTEYYYGSNNIEFSTKFVTTDTAQTISGVKTITDTNLEFKSTSAEYGVSAGDSSVIFKDKNNLQTFKIYSRVFSSGLDNNLVSFFLTQKVDNTYYISNGIQLFANTGNKNVILRPILANNNADGLSVSLGDSNRRWQSVYANNYYYGNDNVEFSTKFVTTDTNQTISGGKTFSEDIVIGNSDTTQDSKRLVLKSSKVNLGDANSDSWGISFNAGTSYAVLINSKKVTSTQNLQFTIRTKDTNNDLITADYRFRLFTDGTSTIEPNVTDYISLGSSANKWKDVQTNLVNGLTPSSLSMPATRGTVDISGYITDLTGNTVSTYSPVVNGYIVITCNSTDVDYIKISNNLDFVSVIDNTNNQFTSGILGVWQPCIAGIGIQIRIKASALNSAKFIPCQGNV